ncbi:beta-ketoacyl synthase chain length factor [bacterium]|nr:beta-ketoacyl synthase chain length factor [bacterium]
MKTNVLEFFVNKFNYTDTVDGLDLSNLSPIIRRRMSTLDKITFSVLDKTYTDSVQNIVFSSQYGEVDRLLKIIDQYTQNNEVSPNTFSGSVHNYPVSFFLLNKKLSIPYTAISAYENSISSGLLVSLISKYDNILYCYCDVNNGIVNALAINLSRFSDNLNNKYAIKMDNNNGSDDSFDNYTKLFNGTVSSLKTPNYTIEKVIK